MRCLLCAREDSEAAEGWRVGGSGWEPAEVVTGGAVRKLCCAAAAGVKHSPDQLQTCIAAAQHCDIPKGGIAMHGSRRAVGGHWEKEAEEGRGAHQA